MNYFEMVGWFLSFLVALAFPPLLIIWAGAVIVRFARKRIQKSYRREVAERDRDIPPRGYPSGQALRNRRIK